MSWLRLLEMSVLKYDLKHYRFRLDFQKGDQHTDDKWLIHGTKRHKDNQLQSMVPPVESRENKLLLFQWSCKPRPYVSIVERLSLQFNSCF